MPKVDRSNIYLPQVGFDLLGDAGIYIDEVLEMLSKAIISNGVKKHFTIFVSRGRAENFAGLITGMPSIPNNEIKVKKCSFKNIKNVQPHHV